MRVIGRQCPSQFLFASKDLWSPESHMQELRDMQNNGIIPANINLHYESTLRHDFVATNDQARLVTDLIAKWIRKNMISEGNFEPSRL